MNCNYNLLTEWNKNWLELVYNPPPPLFDLKIVYSYVIEDADSESNLGLHGRALVSEIMVFLRIRVTCIVQLNDLFCTTIRENASINTPSKKIPYIHPQK